MAEQHTPALHEVLGRLAEVVDGGAASADAELRMRRMEGDLGAAVPTRFTGASGTEVAQALRWMDDADRALLRFGEIEQQLPVLQAAADRYARDSRGKWIALAAVGAILLAILIGQLI